MAESPLNIDSGNAAYMERLLEEFQRDPSAVPAAWREYFAGNGHAGGNGNGSTSHRFRSRMRSVFNSPAPTAAEISGSTAELQDAVDQLIRAYRVRGHLVAK